jgi:hypothetical protein
MSSTRASNGSFILTKEAIALAVFGTRGHGDSMMSSDVSDDLICS